MVKAVKKPAKEKTEINEDPIISNIVESIAPYTAAGLIATFEDGQYHFSANGREDSGSLTAPIHVIVNAAKNVYGKEL